MTLLNIVVKGRIDDGGGMCLNGVETVPHIHNMSHPPQIALMCCTPSTKHTYIFEYQFAYQTFPIPTSPIP